MVSKLKYALLGCCAVQPSFEHSYMFSGTFFSQIVVIDEPRRKMKTEDKNSMTCTHLPVTGGGSGTSEMEGGTAP